MPLLDLKTDLTSVPFGMDRPNGGSSKQPFIVKDIPGKDKTFLDQIGDESTGDYGMTVGNTFGFRNALLNPGTALDDVERLYKLYTQTSTGLVFEAKQVALGLLSEPTAVWNPLAVGAQELLNIPGIGHIPSFLNPNIREIFTYPEPGPTDFRAANRLKAGQTDVYQLGSPGDGTNPLLRGKVPGTDNKLGTSIVRSRKHYNVVYDKKDAINLNVNDTTPIQNIAPLSSTADKMALVNLYTAPDSVAKSKEISGDIPSDFIKFKIKVVDNDNPSQFTHIHFRAFLESFSDSFSAEWSDQKFVGRGEAFYRYGGFSRSNSLSFKVAVQSRQEQRTLYEKLTYLASLTAPDYSSNGFMRGSLIYLTVGDYLVDVPGVLGGLSLTIDPNSPWEIAKLNNGKEDKNIAQLPHVITVDSFEFKPIHNFVPQKGSKFIGYDNWDSDTKQSDLIKDGTIRAPKSSSSSIVTVPTLAQSQASQGTNYPTPPFA